MKSATEVSFVGSREPPTTDRDRAPGVIRENGSGVHGQISRVMLLGQGWHQTAYVIAALHDAGIETMLLSTDRPDHLGLGRYCGQVQSPSPESPDYVPFLREQVAQFRPDVLIPLTELLIQLLWSLEPPPAPIYPPSDAWQRKVITDRRAFYECAADAGVPIAPWMTLTGPADLEQAAQRFGFPLVLRGTAGSGGGQVHITPSMAEARAAYETLQAVSPGSPFAQAYADGDRYIVGGVFLRGEAIRSCVLKILQRWPHETSPSVRVRTVRDTAMEAHMVTMMRRLRWSGIVDADFIRDKNGAVTLLEVNTRPWASLVAAEHCGAGICRAFAELLAGRPVTPRSTCRTGIESIGLARFVMAHRRETVWRTLRHMPLRDLYLCLRAVPWRRAGLALHTLRSAYRVCS